MARRARTLAAGVFVCLAACKGIGPGTVTRDRFNYSEAIADSWKDQMLLNVVKLRYLDPPVFLDVVSVISQYSLEGTVSAAAPPYGSGSVAGVQAPTVGGTATYRDRPTITYSPLSGEKFTRSLMTPIRPDALLFLIQSGWPVDFIMNVTVKTINGVDNASAAALFEQKSDPRWVPLLEKMRKIQRAKMLGSRIERKGEKDASILFFRRVEGAEEIAPLLAEVLDTLGLDPDVDEYNVTYGAVARNNREVAMLTRSMLELLIEMASRVEVPAEDIEEKRVGPVAKSAQDGIIAIHTSEERPERPYATVRYRDRWFYIDDQDVRSKRMFTFLMFLFSLTETGGGAASPVITVTT